MGTISFRIDQLETYGAREFSIATPRLQNELLMPLCISETTVLFLKNKTKG